MKSYSVLFCLDLSSPKQSLLCGENLFVYLMELRFLSMKNIKKNNSTNPHWNGSSHFMCTRIAHSWIFIFFLLLTAVINLVRCNLMNDIIFFLLYLLLNFLIPDIYSNGKPSPVYSGKWIKFTANIVQNNNLFVYTEWNCSIGRKFGSKQLLCCSFWSRGHFMMSFWPVNHNILGFISFSGHRISVIIQIVTKCIFEHFRTAACECSYRFQCKKAIEMSSIRAEPHYYYQRFEN